MISSSLATFLLTVHALMSTAQSNVELIDSQVLLPNGRRICNRLVKSAMEEGISHTGGTPGPWHRQLYRTWGEGGWGVIITGNVQVDRQHLATPHDRFVPDLSASTIEQYRQWNEAILEGAISQGQDAPLTIAQLSHPGLQSSPLVSLARMPWSPALAPISARPDLGTSYLGQLLGHVIWPVKSRRLSSTEWTAIVDQFVQAAWVMQQSGWGGVQVHSAHGYLLAEYLSPHTNPFPEALPGVPEEVPLRLHLLYLILHGIHSSVPSEFVLSVKVNCSDFVQGGLDEEQAASIVKQIVSWGVADILEVSGGTYASPAFASPETIGKPAPTSTRQSLFAHFTTSLLPHLPPPPAGPAILLTGGLHDRPLIAASLRDRACDLVGIGRPACVRPHLPKEVILNRDVPDDQTYLGGYNIRGAGLVKGLFGGGSGGGGIPLVGAGVSTLWHEMQLIRLGRGAGVDLGLHWIWGAIVEFAWFGILAAG